MRPGLRHMVGLCATGLRTAGLLLFALTATVNAAELTIERLFAAPDLAGDSLRTPHLSPDGKLVAYLKGAADNRDRLDLWAYDIAAGKHRLLIDARQLAPDVPLSAEEAARRERQRTASLSGILEYQFAPDSRHILVPLGGDLYLYDLAAPPGKAVRRLTNTQGYETDAQVSPSGRYVSFIREQNLIVLEVASGRETAITTAGGGTVSCGTAEFIAQEELDRRTGYWWSPDEQRIAYTKVDEAGVAASERFEIDATGTRVVEQRYPYTGAANAKVELYVAPLANPAAAVRMDLGVDADFYLARVAFMKGTDALLAQRLSRNQQRLDLLRLDPATGASTTLLTETSANWVPLHDALAFLPQRRQFIWSSWRDGYENLYLYDYQGQLVRQLTHGANGVALAAADERHGWLYYTARDNPRERQLLRVRLDDPQAPQPLTTGAGWHAVTMSKDASVFLDNFSNATTPPQLRLVRADGHPLQVLVPNTLAAGHPFFPYLADQPRTEFGTLTASDGQLLHYSLLKPAHMEPGKRYPVVVNVYGGPHVQQVTDTWSGGSFNQLLARHGYLVFTLDNRGSGARGERFESAQRLHFGSVEVEDQVAGVAFLRALPYVDGERIGIWGWSFGGYLTLMCLLQAPDSFAAGVSGAPVTDWRLYDTAYTERYMATPQQNPAGYRDSDVLTYAKNLKRPLLLIHGMADDNVLFTNSTTLMRELQAANLPFELMTYPGGKHGLLRNQDMGPHAYHAMLEFFDRQLRP